ncbi:MAG TPA: carbon storage regulator [Burkholderiaceae bacterium]|nr:carbon storage regulator [Burkholderiaceae bacterium]
MLFITRRIGETIVIDGDITVQVVYVRGAIVRLGIEAPPDVSIQRGENLPPTSEENHENI